MRSKPTLESALKPPYYLAMTALLESPAVRERVHLMSLKEYHRAGETGVLSKNVELLRGIVVTKMSKSPLHELVAQKLTDVLLEQVPKEFKVRRESPLTLRDSEPEPDISVIKGKPDDWATAHPSSAQLVIEVAVSRGELAETKADIYAEAGIPEYWLVRPEERRVEIYREPSAEGYLSKRSVRENETLRCGEIPEVEFPLAAILPAQR